MAYYLLSFKKYLSASVFDWAGDASVKGGKEGSYCVELGLNRVDRAFPVVGRAFVLETV
jgi:hypothetical protein